MPDQEVVHLKPGLRSADNPRIDPLFQVSYVRVPPALSEARRRFDRYRCITCGFVAAKYHMTYQFGASPRSLADLRTVCWACWHMMNLESAEINRSGRLIWLPELAQTELNRSMAELYVARISSGPPSAIAGRLLNILSARTKEIVHHVGYEDLSGFVRALREANTESERSEALLSHFKCGLRLLPLDRWIVREADIEFNRFPQMLAYWRSRNGPLYLAHDRFAVIAQNWLERLDETI